MKLFLSVFCCFVWGMPYCQSNMQDASVDDLHNAAILKIRIAADSLFADKKYSKSVSLYKRIVRLNPGNSYATAKIFEINVLLVNLEKYSSKKVVKKTSTAEILFKAKNIQEMRIEKNRNYYANRNDP